ncbi:PREDICTED: AP-4 complex subunit epsilon-1 [Nanorana parkeri]|uniref:AP-4 complex subunit epsilon-1 n=1 Tax=Nanorana parkeri TaxID=125878 RepID=UPI000854A3E5|nr:PREDICTED: AP-4 complex subunit epsilon-1 [Nanorana parkeri]
MSEIVERTLSALPGLLLQEPPPGASSKLGNLIRNITGLSSRQEEEKLIQQELASLKSTVSSPNTTLRQMKECMVRLIYCEMLGYEASFGYIHAIKLAQQGNLLEKRVGYLAVSLFLHENHELLLLLVNTVLKDLQSTNLVEVCMALTVVSQIFPREMIPAALPLIEDKLQHSKEIVRRKAVLALYKFYVIAPTQVQHIQEKFRKALCDRDVGVMAASLHIYLRAIKDNPSGYKDLTDSFATILKQVVGGKLPVDFNYHSVPAPWLQIQLLRILRLLGKDDPSTSELIYDVLDESLRRAEINHNITYAILFECVQTIYTIYPKSDLFEKAAKCIGRFVLSPKINLKYLGLKALTYVIQQDPNLALQHQMTIIECLDHPDPIIKRETLELLYRITNEQNVTVIVQKMLEYLKESKDEYAIITLVGKIADLAEKYSPNNQWFVETMNIVFSIGGDMVHPDIPNNFLRLLAEGFSDEKEDGQLRLYAVQSYLALLEMENVHYPQRFLQVISWVLGEYAYLAKHMSTESVLRKLYGLLCQGSVTSETKAWIMAAITKLAAVTPHSSLVDKLIQEFSTCLDTGIRQQACELKSLWVDTQLIQRLFPLNSSCEDLSVDASLSFLDGFVAEALSKGAAPYKPHHQRQEEKLSREKALNLEPYGLCFSPSLPSVGLTDGHSPSGISVASEASGNSAETSQKEENRLKMDIVKKVWGKEGYLLKKESKSIKPESISPPLESGISLGEDDEHPGVSGEQPLELISEEQEKKQLASSLFVGLGSSAISLMGKTEQTTHKFKRKSKMGKKVRDQASLYVSVDQNHVTQTLPNDGHSTDSRLLPSQGPGTIGEETVGAKVPSLFANTNLDIVQANEAPLPILEAPRTPYVPSLLPELAQYTHTELAELTSNGTLSIYSSKVWKDDNVLLALVFVNQDSSTIKSITVKMEDTDTVTVSKSLCCQFSYLEGAGVQQCWECVQLMKPCNNVTVTGCVTYQIDSEVPSLIPFSIEFVLLDFIRPLVISTEEFGKLWLTLSNDVKEKVQVPNSQQSLPELLPAMQRKVNLHVVQVIGDEGIVACQLLPSAPCLLHCHLQEGMLLLWIRSSSSALSDCLLDQCQKALEDH